jgi:shikimate kinase
MTSYHQSATVFDIQGLNIYLIGMMGCGKSTIGPLLAAKLGYSFLDTDITLAKYCAKIFETFKALDYSCEDPELSASELAAKLITKIFPSIGEPGSRKIFETCKTLDYSFEDPELSASEVAAKIIAKLFQTIGEPEFRKIETQALTDVSAYTRLVVATGGGIAISGENWNHLHQGLVIWLNPSVDLLVERLHGDTSRPILATSEDLQTKLERILAARRYRYAEADIHLPFATQLAPEEIVDRILTAIPTVLKTSSVTQD